MAAGGTRVGFEVKQEITDLVRGMLDKGQATFYKVMTFQGDYFMDGIVSPMHIFRGGVNTSVGFKPKALIGGPYCGFGVFLSKNNANERVRAFWDVVMPVQCYVDDLACCGMMLHDSKDACPMAFFRSISVPHLGLKKAFASSYITWSRSDAHTRHEIEKFVNAKIAAERARQAQIAAAFAQKKASIGA